MNVHDRAVPVDRRLLTPGVRFLLVLAGAGVLAGLYRFLFGLEASTNLNQQYPWGIWIIGDVSLIALAAGGFTTAAIAHVFHHQHYHALARPALVVALLGYTFACILLAADLGRYYNIWHPILPNMWQGNSALFEVGMCVMCYLTVLYIEFIPVFCERFIGDPAWPRLGRICSAVNCFVGKTMFLFLILGVAISCLHQSSLGHVMVLAPSKLHPLWYTPILSLLFLMSAIMVGFPTVIFASICGSWALGLRPQMHMLGCLAKYVPFLLSVYLAFKIGDMFIRRSFVHLSEGSLQSAMFVLEMIAGLIVPFVMTLFPKVRSSPHLLCAAAGLVMFGVILNRTNVYLVGYQPVNVTEVYFPSLAEWGLTIGAAAALCVCWRAIVTYFPVLTQPRLVATA
ncbi:MAG: Ni/Fe-hydrogenase cytochrome b subunit [Phycisphaerales bacterium]|nr:MAG: Ni/Fe-hydrogenase cytochrome b subunit [Phycisphaerales bacterium]